jgi:hypothetical protein
VANAVATRIAIIELAPPGVLEPLLVAELSKTDGVELVERTALAQIGDEAKIQQLASENPTALGRRINADGLLLVSKSKEGYHARLTSVSLGYVLFDDQFESRDSLEDVKRIIRHKVEGYCPRLKLTPEHTIPVSILNLRADISSVELNAPGLA